MKKFKVLLVTLIIILGAMFFYQTYAADTERKLGVQLNRPFTDSKYQFRAGANGEDKVYTVVKIFDDEDRDAQNKLLYSKALYCLRGGLGFGANDETDIATTPITYTEFGEMHSNAEDVIAKYKDSVIAKYEENPHVNLDRLETINGKYVNIYNAILWILDEAYLPVDSENYKEAEYKEELLTKVGIAKVSQADITKDDLEVIQQLAIWYFANYDEQTHGDLQSVSRSTMFPAQFLTINDGNNIDNTREENLNKIYQYFIYGAIDNNARYQGTNERKKYTGTNEFDKNVELEIESVDYKETVPNIYHSELYYYKIGPFKIKNDVNEGAGRETLDATSIALCDSDGNTIKRFYEIPVEDEETGEIASGGLKEIYTVINSEGQPVTELEKGVNYYIKFKKVFEKGFTLGEEESLIPETEKYDVSEVTLNLSTSYTLSTATFLIKENSDQPVVEISKEKISESDKITTKPPKEFDLALRKFITSINGKTLTGENSRVPQININTLINGIEDRNGNKEYTATYTHPKNALSVETGDKVVYTIRIYNEGELDGKATSVTDYLPTGLKFIPASESTINREYGWTNPSNDGKTIVTEYLNNTNIKAFDKTKTTEEAGWQKASTGESGLYYADLQIECEVIAEISGENQELRNIAAITEDSGDDRDSVPGDPGRTDYNPPTDNSTYKEDDDDYEDLVLPTKSFDLSLRKFISKVERNEKEVEIESREPAIKIKDLKDRKSTTAKYIHPKNKLNLKRGDIIYYTIRVYNEGDLDGYATLVKDYLPEGLELVEGKNDIWTVNGNILSTDSLKDQKLLGYDRAKVAASSGWQKSSDDETGLYYYDLTVVCKIKDNVEDWTTLVNIAEISEDKSEPTDIADRDSEPDNFPDENKNNNYEGNGNNEGYYPGKQDDDDFERVTVEPDKVFDLSLRKFITSIKRNSAEIEFADRTPKIDTTTLINGIEDRTGNKEYTATYTHPKNALSVETGDKVVYTIRIYNEGELDGKATSVTDYLPTGLKFIPVSESTINREYGWTNPSNDGKTIVTEYLNNTNIKAFDKSKTTEEAGWQKASTGVSGLYYADLQIECEVIAEISGENQELRNIAAITEDSGDDRDSIPGDPGRTDYNPPEDNSTYKEDDDDYEDLVLPTKIFDLSLRKFITSINGKTLTGENSRVPKINTNTLINGTFDRNGQKENTATYEHSKEPLVVKKGDIVTYTLRIYNEGERDGFATEIKDYIPEGLALIVNYDTNTGWELPDNLDSSKIIKLVGEDGFYKTQEEVKNLKVEDFEGITTLNEVQLITGKVDIITTELNDQLIKSFDKTKTAEEAGWQKAATGEGGLYYKDVQLSCLVIAENTCKDVLTNIAEISEDKDEKGKDVIDRDSTPDNVPTKNEDDDDYEPVILKYFDLALRKFITGVETNGKTEEVTTRIPVPTIGEDENIVYNHTKDPVYVANNDTVIYTIRVYNEGTIAGYAEEITDNIPDGLEYLPEHDTNKKYEWIMIDKEGNVTEKIEEAVKIKTDYLSEEKEAKSKLVITDETTGEVKESEIRDNLIDPFDSSKPISTQNPLNPDYRDVKVAFKITEPNTSDRIIINNAQISEDSDDDEDSVPDEWNEGEDDQDKEYIYVKYFDLSLLKWVTKTIVTVDGKTTTTETGFKPNTGKTETTGIRDNNEVEPIAKVEIDKKKLSKTDVKFVYKIRVTNEGEIAGYATEITDYIPNGLEFLEEDNKSFGWVKQGEDKVTTRALETVLLQPGESAEVEIVFTWKKDVNNLGLKTNIAEISEDYNDNNSEDIDSVPNNKKDTYEKEQEDDDDFALVILSIKTGKGVSYTILVISILTLLSCGMYLIKKYVLTY